MAKSYLNRNDLPRGLRNNNPGNLVRTNIAWEGKIPHSQSTDTKFEQFIDLRHGIRAKMRDIITDIDKGNNTISGLITEFAPPFENNTAAYITAVATAVGLNPHIKVELTQELLIAMCKAIAVMENGTIVNAYITHSDYLDAIAILGKPLKKKVTA